jgi:hypothetical protein
MVAKMTKHCAESGKWIHYFNISSRTEFLKLTLIWRRKMSQCVSSFGLVNVSFKVSTGETFSNNLSIQYHTNTKIVKNDLITFH